MPGAETGAGLRRVRLRLGLLPALALAACGGDPEPAALPQERGTIAVAGLEQPLRIDRNRHGVPQIRAESARDAYFGLGFAHAQDRLGQLLALRRSAQGRAAERAGAEALEADVLARLIDFAGLAEREWDALPQRARRALEAYAAGVNARIARVAAGETGAPPGARPDAIEPWRPQDSLALWKLASWNLAASVELSLVLHELVGVLGVADAERFFPVHPAERGGSVRRLDATPPLARGGDAGARDFAAWARGLRALRRASGLDGHGVGSTAFVIGGAHTRSGLPLLVADSHSEPTLPAPFHVAHLRAPGFDVAGLTLPGVPVFWSGRNETLAWASVHPGAVVTDLYLETLRRDGREVHDGRSWRAVELREERFAVRGSEEVVLTLRRSARGPLLPAARGVSPEGSAAGALDSPLGEGFALGARGEAIAVAWTGARADAPSGVAARLALARADDVEALRSALAHHGDPVLAVAWAASDGAAGVEIAGWLPQRTLAAPLLPLPGRAPWYHWSQRVPPETLPSRALEDGQGFLVVADAPLPVSEQGAALDRVWRPGVRAGRLEARIRALGRRGIALRDAAALLLDEALPRSLAVVEAALALAGSPRDEEARELATLLRDWDGEAGPGSVGATAYHVFLDALAAELFAEPLGPLYARLLALRQLDLEGLVLGVLEDAARGRGEDRWSDAARVREAVARTLRESWLALSFARGPNPERWTWGEAHAVSFRDPLGARPALGPFAQGGAPHALLAGPYRVPGPAEAGLARRGAEFAPRVVPSARIAVDLAAADLLLFALAPGQSEHRGHAHYDSGLAPWREGRHALLATRAIEIDEYSVARLELEPLVE